MSVDSWINLLYIVSVANGEMTANLMKLKNGIILIPSAD
jgi:hypothetical protein